MESEIATIVGASALSGSARGAAVFGPKTPDG